MVLLITGSDIAQVEFTPDEVIAAVVWLIYQKVKEAGLGRESTELSSFFINP